MLVYVLLEGTFESATFWTKPENRAPVVGMTSVWDRRQPRITYQVPVGVIDLEKERVLSASSIKVSSGGMFVDTSEVLEIGTPLMCNVPYGEGQDAMQVRGRVAWQRERGLSDPLHPIGLGIEFVDLTEEESEQLEQIVGDREETSHPVKLQLPGLNSSVEACAKLTEQGIFIRTALPFLSIDSDVEFSFTDGTDSDAHRGRIVGVHVHLDPGSKTPRLQVEVELESIGHPEVASSEDPILLHKESSLNGVMVEYMGPNDTEKMHPADAVASMDRIDRAIAVVQPAEMELEYFGGPVGTPVEGLPAFESDAALPEVEAFAEPVPLEQEVAEYSVPLSALGFDEEQAIEITEVPFANSTIGAAEDAEAYVGDFVEEELFAATTEQPYHVDNYDDGDDDSLYEKTHSHTDTRRLWVMAAAVVLVVGGALAFGLHSSEESAQADSSVKQSGEDRVAEMIEDSQADVAEVQAIGISPSGEGTEESFEGEYDLNTLLALQEAKAEKIEKQTAAPVVKDEQSVVKKAVPVVKPVAKPTPKKSEPSVVKPAEKASVKQRETIHGLRIVEDENTLTLRLPFKGKSDQFQSYKLADPPGIAVNLPFATPTGGFESSMEPKNPSVRLVWLRQRLGGTHFRVFFSEKRSDCSASIKGASVVIRCQK